MTRIADGYSLDGRGADQTDDVGDGKREIGRRLGGSLHKTIIGAEWRKREGGTVVPSHLLLS
jgi:hypothetical protein